MRQRALPGLGPDTVRILFHLTVGAIDGLLTLDPDLCVLNQSSMYTILSVNNSDSSILTTIIAPSRKMRYFCLCFRLTFICWLWFTRGCYPTWWALHTLYIRRVYGGQSFTVVTIFRKQKRAQNSTSILLPWVILRVIMTTHTETDYTYI